MYTRLKAHLAVALALGVGALALSGSARAEAGLQPERLDLGDTGPGRQAYNFQEAGDWRVWALSGPAFAGARVMLQRRDPTGRWGPPQAAPFTDPRWRDTDPHLSPDSRVLTFVSDRPMAGDAPAGDLDLFESRRGDDGSWSAPVRLAPPLQSPRYELGPERIGTTLFFGSARAGGPGPLAVWRSDGAAPPEQLPAPVNDATQNGDFTLSPDGRWGLWWSLRSGDGDLYVAERVGRAFGPALRLPVPINGPGFEFTPAISPDGQWLSFASTRGPDGRPASDGLAHVWRVRWPAVLAALGPAATAHTDALLDAQVRRVWRGLSHGEDAAPDGEALRALAHPQAQLWGSQAGRGGSSLLALPFTRWLAALERPQPALWECETHRHTLRAGTHAMVYSVVDSRRQRDQPTPDLTGVNSLLWHLGESGWQLLALHYGVDVGLQIPATQGLSERDAVVCPARSVH